MGKFDDDIHDDVAEQGDDVLDQIAASAPLSTKGNEKAAAPKEDEATDKNSPVYDVPKLWKRLIKNSSGASFSAYAKMAVREKLQRDGLI
jgi:hypothetical protein